MNPGLLTPCTVLLVSLNDFSSLIPPPATGLFSGEALSTAGCAYCPGVRGTASQVRLWPWPWKENPSAPAGGMLDRHEGQAAAGWVPPEGAFLDHISLPEQVQGRNEPFPAMVRKWLGEQDNCFEM